MHGKDRRDVEMTKQDRCFLKGTGPARDGRRSHTLIYPNIYFPSHFSVILYFIGILRCFILMVPCFKIVRSLW